MKGLILKDFYVIFKQARILLFLAVLYAFIPMFGNASVSVWFTLFFCGVLPISCIGFEERSKWNKYAFCLPYSRKTLVLEKYILGIICIFFAAVIGMIGEFIRFKITSPTMDYLEILKYFLLVISSILLFLSLNLPIIFKFGSEKGRLVFITLTMLFSILITVLGSLISKFNIPTNSIAVNVFILFGASAIYALSYCLSVAIYKRTEF